MCGIAGVIKHDSHQITESLLKKMTDAIAHRGPDGEGAWVSANGKVGFGHRRLSIIDLSDDGKQPMHYLGRYTITFNGEIYNYIEIKEFLLKKGYQFQSHCDTEVLMAIYDYEGINCLQRLDGMFAFALYDEKEQIVFCAKDRFGEKPFFYNYDDFGMYFASEMKAIWAAGVDKTPDSFMMFNYLQFGHIYSENDPGGTFYSNIKKIPPAHYGIYDFSRRKFSLNRYWDIDLTRRDHSSFEEACEQFSEKFHTSISRRMRSDVAVGSSLSGGLDSSVVVHTIAEMLLGRIANFKTFSAIFPGFKKNEQHYQEIMTAHTNTKNFSVIPSSEGLNEKIETVFHHQEEPFISSSIFAQFEVFKLAKQHNVTVLLDGQGADEVLGGYHKFYFNFFWGLKTHTKNAFQEQFDLFRSIYPEAATQISKEIVRQGIKKFIPAGLQKPMKSLKLKLDLAKVDWDREFLESQSGLLNQNFFSPFSLNEALYNETCNHGLEQLLRYADRNSMASSREVRLPFLFHELVEFLFSLPPTYKINAGWTKYIARKAFDKKVPDEIVWRKDKIGYETPQHKWLTSKESLPMINDCFRILGQHGIIKKGMISNREDTDFIWRVIMIAHLLKQ